MALTWRNVDAPNLSGAALAVGQATQGIGQAFNDIAAGIGQFGQAQQDRADAAALQAASRITNSQDYANALASGTLLTDAGINPNTISSRAAEMLANRQNQLLDNDFQQAQIENQRQDNQLALKRFGLDERKFEQDLANNELRNQMTQYRFGREQLGDQRQDLAYEEKQVAQQLAYDILNTGSDAAGARQLLSQASVPDRVKAAVSVMIGLPQQSLSPSGSPVVGQSGRGADAVYGYGDFGAPSVPLSKGSFGDAYDFGQTLIPATRGQVGAGPDKGTSAVGAFQFIGSTMQDYAQKVFGDNWRDVPFTFENQAKIAEALFNDKKGGNLQAVWAGLPDSRDGAYKDMSFEQFMREVLPRESGMTLDEIRQAEQADQRAEVQSRINNSVALADVVDKGMAGNAAQRLGNIDLNQFFQDSQNTDPDLTKAADRATKQYPSLKGTPLNDVALWLDEIQQKASASGTPLTASQAVHILGASMSPAGTFPFHPFNGAASGLYFDENKMEQVLKDVNQGGNLGRSIVSRQIATDRGQLSNATAVLAQAVKDDQVVRERLASGQPVSQEVQNRVSSALTKALKNHETLTKKFSDPAYQQKLEESNAEVAGREEAGRNRAAALLSPVSGNAAQGIGYAPATAITSGLPNQAATLLEQRLAR
ncbi:MAG: hypothetical protein ACK5LG_22005 [Bacteroides thetaiotaomicron]